MEEGLLCLIEAMIKHETVFSEIELRDVAELKDSQLIISVCFHVVEQTEAIRATGFVRWNQS